MSGFYDGNDGQRTYQFMNAAIDTAAIFGRFQGPAGKVGRITGVEWHLVAATTTAATAITFDTAAGLTTPVSVSVPVAAINLGGSATEAELALGDELPADTIVECTSDGGAAAGDADMTITVQWY
jgi:hypothetical protein